MWNSSSEALTRSACRPAASHGRWVSYKGIIMPHQAEVMNAMFTSTLSSVENQELQSALNTPDVRTALHEYQCAQAKRDSISRKLCGGSELVTAADLARWENALSEAKEALRALVKRTPILVQHQAFASVITA
jgi:hypothetical protein